MRSSSPKENNSPEPAFWKQAPCRPGDCANAGLPGRKMVRFLLSPDDLCSETHPRLAVNLREVLAPRGALNDGRENFNASQRWAQYL